MRNSDSESQKYDEVRVLFERFNKSTDQDKEELAEQLATLQMPSSVRKKFVEHEGEELRKALLSEDKAGKYWLIAFTGNLGFYGSRFLEQLEELKKRDDEGFGSKSYKSAIGPALSRIRSVK